jgi:glycolate oxidase
MALSKEIYQEFEDVVGVENICSDPAIMPAYYGTDFAVVILPKDTAEVQTLVKLCNKHRLPFKAICTGWTGRFPAGTILFDMRRMNKIVEINEKNMYAVVEPYVISAELQAELMKRGLTCNLKGAGANCSAMLRGHGALDQTTSGDDRNHLAIEWVTPEGEIVRSGALGSTDDWFCGDGPGPSLRAILTSAVPPGVTPGVFTKAAVKVYHWPGPTKFPAVGHSPKYTLSEIPANMTARYYSFPTVEKMWQAELKIGENELVFALYGVCLSMIAANMTTCNEDEEKAYTRINREAQGPGFFLVITGNSEADFAYKMKAIDQIISEADGKLLKSVADPETEGVLLSQCVRTSGSIRETFRAGGAFNSIPIMGQRDLNIKWVVGAGEAKKPLIKKGYIVDDGGGFFGWGVEQGHLGKTEIFCRYNPKNPEAKAAVEKWQKEQSDRAFAEHYFANLMGGNAEEVGKSVSNYHVWWGKIVKALDPNGVSTETGSLV